MESQEKRQKRKKYEQPEAQAGLDSYRFASFRLDLLSRCVWQTGPLNEGTADERAAAAEQPLSLTPKAFAVLQYLVEHPQRLVTKDELFSALWADTIVTDGALKVCIREIRKVLRDASKAPQFVETVHGRGYRWIAPALSGEEGVSDGHTDSSPAVFQPEMDQRLVGRESAMRQLQASFAQAEHGRRQIVFVTGETGIGKTTLVEAFVEGLHEGHTDSPGTPRQLRWAQGQCVEHYGTGEAYFPVLDALGQVCRSVDGSEIETVLDQYAPTWLVQMPAVSDTLNHEQLQQRLLGTTRERMLREMAEALEVLTAEIPLVLVLEDLHWSDPSTIELLAFLARRRTPARLLVIGTYRPVDVIVSGHPLREVKGELVGHGLGHELPLELLSVEDVAQYLSHYLTTQHDLTTRRLEDQNIAGSDISQGDDKRAYALAQAIHRRTAGNPLFMVNLVAYADVQSAESETDVEEAVEVGMPETLRELIAQQVDRLAPEVQAVLEAASVVGLQFSTQEVQAALGAEDVSPVAIEKQCDQLARRGQFLRALGVVTFPDGSRSAQYEFTHTLYQEVLVQRLVATQQGALHRRIGEWGEAVYGNRASEMAAEMAVHFIHGGETSKAVHYLQVAAETALQRHAHHEALVSLNRGLALLEELPETPQRIRQELHLQTMLGPVLIATQGNATPQVRQLYARAQELSQRAETRRDAFPVLFGLRSSYLLAGEVDDAHTLAEQLMQTAQHTQDVDLLIEAHVGLASTLFFRGEFAACRTQVEHGLALYTPDRHQAHISLYGLDPGVFCQCRLGQVLWLMGYPDQAAKAVQAALELAHELAHPYSLGFALNNAAWVHVCRQEGAIAQEQADAAIQLCTEQEFPFLLAWAVMLKGSALVQQGKGEDGLSQLRRGITTVPMVRTKAVRPFMLTAVADGLAREGQYEAGLATLAETWQAGWNDRVRILVAERYRLQGEMLWNAECRTQNAERQKATSKMSSVQLPASSLEHLEQAVEIARQQGAKSLELRAALGLARVWQTQGQHAVARDLVTEVYDWFTEGFETLDLQRARAWLTGGEGQPHPW